MEKNDLIREIQELETRGVPVSVGAETAVLGAILLHNPAFNQAAPVITAADFSLDSHRKIYQAITELLEAGKSADFVTLTEKLSVDDLLRNVGGVQYITSLTDGLPRVKNISQYVDIVREKSRGRGLFNICTAALAQIQELETADDVLQGIQEGVLRVIQQGMLGKSASLDQVARETLNRLIDIRKRQEVCIGLSSGIDDFDALTTGFRDGEFYVFGGRPGTGKTAWMCQAIRKNCKRKRRIGVFSIEVPREQIMTRIACMETGISVFDTRDPRVMSDINFNYLTECIAALGEQWKDQLFIEDTPRLHIKQLASVARAWVANGAEMIMVDFLQKAKAPGRDSFEKVTYIADELWGLGRSLGVPVVALSQLKRSEHNEKPTMDDFRSSGEIEQNANAAALFWREKGKDQNGKEYFTQKDEIILAKQRSGPVGAIEVRFDAEVGMYRPRDTEAPTTFRQYN